MRVILRNIFFGVVLILILIACFSMRANATDFYFSSSTGNDNNLGTLASPYASLSKLNSIFPTRAAGDRFLLKRGDTFYGFIVIGRSGTAAAYMAIDAYGSGANPIVSGFTTLSSWTNLGGGIYETPTTTALLPYVNMVLLDGVQEPMGRWPNADAVNDGWNNFESFVGTTSITDAQLSTTPYNWTGAELVMKPWAFLINRSIITSHSGGTLTSAADQQPRSNGYGYFIQNDARTLDQLGEWYHNKATERIRMYFGAELPSNHVIQAATIDSLVYSTGKSYITISNITFEGANGSALNLDGSATNFYVDSCTIQFAGIDGISYSTVNGQSFSGSYGGARVTNTTIEDCNNNGILGNTTVNAIFRDNYIRNTYMIPGMGGEMNGHGWGIRVGAGGLVEYNQIVNSGYAAIYFSGANTIIQKNFIDSALLVKTDGGGIYSALTGGYVAYTGRKLYDNIILNVIGTTNGTPSTSVIKAAYGIYLDDNMNGVEVKGNTIAHSSYGIYLHNNRDNIARQNTLYDNTNPNIFMVDDGLGIETSGMRLASNILVTKTPTEVPLHISDNLDDIGNFGSLDSNIYANLLGHNTNIQNARNNLAIYEYHDLASWRLRYGEDANGAYSQRNVAPYRDLVLVGANKIPSPLNNSTFTNAGEGWSGTSVYSGVAGVMDGGFLAVTPNATAISSVALGIGNVTSGTPYVLRFSVRGNVTYDDQSSFGARVRGTINTPLQYHKVTTSRDEIEMLFVPEFSGAGTLEFLLSEAGTVFYLDNIIFNQATATVTVPSDSIRFEYNASQVATVIPLTGTYKDVYGTSYTTSVTLQPYTSKVLIFETGATTPVVKTDPTITWATPGAITFGTAFSSTQLNASASVAGTYSYSPGIGYIPNAGTTTITLTFVPTNQTLYNTVITTRNIVVNKAVATMAYSVPTLTQTYTGLPLAPTIITTPSGLTIINTLYNSVASTPINSGVYSLSSSLNNSNYTASTITGTFTITKAPATITVTSNLTQEADGNPKPVQAVTNPAGKTLTYVYNGSATVPSAPGTYTVDITVVDANYQGTLQVTLNIVTSVADIFITDILQVYDGTSKSVTVTSPYSYAVTYNPATHVNAGSYEVIATINDGVHVGADTATFVIQKATPVLTWPIPERIFFGTALTTMQLNASSSVPGTWSYSKPLGSLLPVGTQLITATFTPTDTANYNTATITVPIAVYGDVLNYYITNGRTIYINTP